MLKLCTAGPESLKDVMQFLAYLQRYIRSIYRYKYYEAGIDIYPNRYAIAKMKE